MTTPASRRGFLRSLTALPLVGGGLTLIGHPTAVAQPVTRAVLDSYDTWLLYERCKLKAEIYGQSAYWQGMPTREEAILATVGTIPFNNGGSDFHFSPPHDAQPPSTRAALVLAAVGCDWRGGLA